MGTGIISLQVRLRIKNNFPVAKSAKSSENQSDHRVPFK